MNIIETTSYKETLKTIKDRIYKAQYKALQAVNKELILMYWDIGETITEKQEKEKWGENVVEQLSKDLQIEFPGIKGFSASNLWRMRNYFLGYKDIKKLATLSRELGWSHNLLILERCNDLQEREFYLKMTLRQGWSVRTLQSKIKSNEFQKWAINQSNYEETLPVDISTKAEVMLKDEYNFDFLLLDDEHKERDLELAMIKNIRKVLEELGNDFAFMGNQKRFILKNDDDNEEEFFIDLLFYHRKLKSLIVIDLKADKFKPEFAGKMSFYLSLLDKQERFEGENPPIGIIICKSKDRTIVEYSLKSINQPIGVASYKLYSDDKKLPEEYSKYLPSIAEISDKLFALASS